MSGPVIIILLLMFNIASAFGKNDDWTWSYRRKINVQETQDLSSKKNLIFSKVNIPNFSQLIFSWNSFELKKGYFTFWVQPRNAITKKWGNWYKMIDWGNGISKSYSTIVDGDISYIHVRLEMPLGRLADGFRLKIERHNGADLSNLRLLSVCVSNLNKFLPEEISSSILKLRSIKIDGIPKKSQMVLDHLDCKKMCSPTSTSMLVSYLSKRQVEPIGFALNAYDKGLGAYGSWPFNTAQAFIRCSICFFRVVRLNSFAELHAQLSRGMPVVVSVRGKLNGAPQEYNSGHLILVCGWDQKNKEVIVHDPAFESDPKVFHKYGISSFLRAWEKSHRLSYIVEKR